MTCVNIVLRACDIGDIKGDVIGVDAGAWFCYENNIQMIKACGDFDSITSQQKEILLRQDFSVDVLPSAKDQTDFEYALSLCDDYDEIWVYGALGQRKDHEYVNLSLASKDDRIILFDKHNKIKKYSPGLYYFSPDEYTYFSLLVLKAGTITYEGFKYPLYEREIAPGDVYLSSNEIMHKDASMLLEEAEVLVIRSNDA